MRVWVRVHREEHVEDDRDDVPAEAVGGERAERVLHPHLVGVGMKLGLGLGLGLGLAFGLGLANLRAPQVLA